MKMDVVSEAATTVAEKVMASKKLKVKILSKKPAIGPCDFSKQVAAVNCVGKSTLIHHQRTTAVGTEKVNSFTPATKCKADGALECQEEKSLKMDRSTTSNCLFVIKQLMKHRHVFPFTRPVDPVALCIPDYFDIIKNPMDLGTIRAHLDQNTYYGAEDFEADVRLTFYNAMLYNPPNNLVHQYAKELLMVFNNLWKPVKAKLNRQGENIKRKRSEDSIDETTLDVKKNCLGTLSSNVDKLPTKAIICKKKGPEYLKEVSLEKKVPLSDLKAVKDGKAKGSKSSKTCRSDPDSVGPVSRPYDKSAGRMFAHPEILRERPVQCIVKHTNAKEEKPRKKVQCDNLDAPEVKKPSTSQRSRSDPDSDGAVSCLDEEHAYASSPVITGSVGAITEGLQTGLDIQLPPSKALRAAMLKSRFADTILKAQHKTLLQPGGRVDSVTLQLEKERLEKREREEKARIEAELRAAELAARKKEAELKKHRQQERAAARSALEKIERSVDLDNNFHVLRDLEALVGSSLHLVCRDGRSHAVWAQIECGKLRSPLERLGLFIKNEYMMGDDDDEAFLQEEWEEGEVIF